MKNVFMLCGQGSSGKSTYAKFLSKQLKNCEIIAMDNISSQLNIEDRYFIYKSNIIKAIQSDAENIILDLAHDTVKRRQEIYTLFSPPEEINLFVIYLRPSLFQIFENQTKRQKSELSFEQKSVIERLYNAAQLPEESETKSYKFHNTSIFILNPQEKENDNDV